ncbi:LOW QUALITY PROTEIN: EF-hand and coiled-coil domain-containing protein 1 [Poeciliopsis prolifica]|uniref:LOW QUALITY PROTEIN: EF-hand and coiled-coil domain-containing protein 1 n=1 Tax=Poeciliopsis prolifica TaxID=188132 RepID=UPI0024139D67|nr:LOW QUALITY PROTEIN: EF-hand and coiled-coil domain-containing protein 1 [Poeciliopsis prolifica]
MRRTALALPRVEPSPRAARKSEWLRSALAHHHRPDPAAENEIVVLAIGIDQYLQEVFHHLAHPSRDDTVSGEDFAALCAVLGLPGAQRTPEAQDGSGGGGAEQQQLQQQREEFADVCSGLPERLSFRDFHSRLCGCFRVRAAPGVSGGRAWRLPVSEDTELVERQIRVRWPRVRRRKCVSFDLGRDQTGTRSRTVKSGAEEEQDQVGALRELVEDLRSALQGSDARCLALEVALKRERSRTPTGPCGQGVTLSVPTPCGALTQGKPGQTDTPRSQPDGTRKGQRRWDIRDPLLRELKLIRSSRDGQLEEAIKFNERLEEELQWAYQEVRKLQGLESSLRRENSQIRRRAEEAREALNVGLQKVRLIQEQARLVPQLQSKITQLETELLRFSRIGCTCLSESQLSQPEDPSDAEGLQRAVEGRAASDEEEDDGSLKETGNCCSSKEKSVASHNPGCSEGCQNQTVHHPLSLSRLELLKRPGSTADGTDCCSRTGPNQGDKNTCGRFGKVKRPEDEAEKTRLSLLEDKLTDSLTLLLQLRNTNASRKVLEKMVVDSLGVRSTAEAGQPQALQAAGSLSIHLTSSDLPKGKGEEDEEEDKGGGQNREKHLHPPAGSQTNNMNSLLISS